MIYVIAAIIVTFLLLLGYLYLRFPLEIHGIDYYTNGIFVFERQPEGGGFLTLDFPDLFPFSRDKIVWGAIPYSFRFVGDVSYSLRPGGGSTGDHIFRDKRHIIYQGEVVWDGDVETLRLFDGYATDRKNVYIDGFVLRNLDPTSFELLGCGFHRDKNGVYNVFTGYGRLIPEIDKDTFEVRDPQACSSEAPYAAMDRNHLYRSDGVNGFKIIQ